MVKVDTSGQGFVNILTWLAFTIDSLHGFPTSAK